MSKVTIVRAVSDSAETDSRTAVSINEALSLAKLAVTVPAPRVLPAVSVNSATPAAFVRVLPFAGSMVAMSLVRLIIRNSTAAVSDVVVRVTRAVTGASAAISVVVLPAASRSSKSKLKLPIVESAALASMLSDREKTSLAMPAASVDGS